MAISGVSLAPTSLQNPNDPRQQFRQLAQAINSGDLASAQQAFAVLSQTLGNNANSGSNPTDPFSQALQTIGQALQAGDIGGAQQALASLQQAQGAHGRHHHHGHRGDVGSNAGTGSSTPSPSAPPAPTGTSIDVTV